MALVQAQLARERAHLRAIRLGAAVWLSVMGLACGARTGFGDESGPPASVAAGSQSGPDALDAGEMTPDVEVADASEPADDALEPINDASRTAVAIAVGWYTSCVLMSDGTVECWGYGEDGELGDGKLSDRSTPARVPGIHGATAISPGMYVRCALLRGGDVECWGDNAEGEIQNPPILNPSAIPTPVAVPRWKGAREIASVSRTTCALLADSTVSCAGTSPTSSSPWSIQGSSGSTQIAIWVVGGCALGPGGTVACWGGNDEGQLGVGTADFTDGVTAMRVPGLEGVTSIATGSSGFTCALLSNTSVTCWGANNTGQLGSVPVACSGGNGGSCSEVPILVPGLTGVTALTAGDSFACALLSNGTVDCWGSNVNGALGNGTTMPSFAPMPVPGLSHVSAISAAGYHTCALIDDGSVACWGEDSYGELGAPAPQHCPAPCSMRPIMFRP
jgi:alpha-tubulin suppressor-like RCC1 family protein